MLASSKSKRYSSDSLDFIIPYLINHSASPPAVVPPRKRYSVPAKQQPPPNELKLNDESDIEKVYCVRRKNPRPTELRRSKSKAIEASNVTHLRLQPADTPAPPTHKQRFFKVHSHITHLPLQSNPPQPYFSATPQPVLTVPPPTVFNPQPTFNLQAKPDDSPILGIRFKKKEDSNVFILSNPNNTSSLINSTTVLINTTAFPKSTPHKSTYMTSAGKITNASTAAFHSTSNANSAGMDEMAVSFRGEVQRKMKYWREKKEWDKKRGLNVDSIVNRRCHGFQELMVEYLRRMELDEGSRIFLFDSKDLWIKRVLIDRGWVENSNRESKAFHLAWTNKPITHPLFPQQRANHYPHSDRVTSKAGLHKILAKHALSGLQPRTYDLVSEKQAFQQEFIKCEFICKLKKLLKRFDFQDPSFDLSSTGLKKQIEEFITTSYSSEIGPSALAQKLLKVLRDCMILLQTRIAKGCDCDGLTLLLEELQEQRYLSPQEEETIRLLRDIERYFSLNHFLPNYSVIGDDNVWITKNKTSSKGVGISLSSSLPAILKQTHRLAQKYIERPFLSSSAPLSFRKFDIRVWLLLSGTRRPQLHYHHKFYGRICFLPYSLSPASLRDPAAHLTNYALNKSHFQDASHSILLPEQFFQTVQQTTGVDYSSKFYLDLEQLLKKLGAVLRKEVAVGSGGGSFELYGVDLLVDAELQLHLLEVNLSAKCEERHPELTRMLQEMGHGLMNILEDEGGADHGWIPLF